MNDITKMLTKLVARYGHHIARYILKALSGK